MDESERLQRYRSNESYQDDEELANRISSLLNHPDIDKNCMVDAYYYDFSVIPTEIQEKLQLWRDAYLIYGITKEGEIVSKWVDRYVLDSCREIVDGKLIESEDKDIVTFPVINQLFNPELLSTPIPNIFKK